MIEGVRTHSASELGGLVKSMIQVGAVSVAQEDLHNNR